jgi:hypothetical protein
MTHNPLEQNFTMIEIADTLIEQNFTMIEIAETLTATDRACSVSFVDKWAAIGHLLLPL